MPSPYLIRAETYWDFIIFKKIRQYWFKKVFLSHTRGALKFVLTSVTLTLDLWPWPFAWTSLLSMVITLKISWWNDDGNIVKKVWQSDKQTYGQTDWTVHRAACSLLKTSWWCHQMETFSMLLALCAQNLLVTGEFPAPRPVTRSFDVLFDLHLNKLLSKPSRCWWFEMPSCSLWSCCNDIMKSDQPNLSVHCVRISPTKQRWLSLTLEQLSDIYFQNAISFYLFSLLMN